MLMHVLRNVMRRLLEFLLLPFILLSILLSSLAVVVSDEQNIKNALSDNGVYQKVVPSIISQQPPAQPGAEPNPLDDLGVRQLVEQTFQPSLVESTANSVIDG